MPRDEHDRYEGRCRVLMAAMVENCMRDCAALYRMGLWRDTPDELADVDIYAPGVRIVWRQRITGEGMFWVSGGVDTMLGIAAAVVPLRVSKEEFVRGIKRLAKVRTKGADKKNEKA